MGTPSAGTRTRRRTAKAAPFSPVPVSPKRKLTRRSAKAAKEVEVAEDPEPTTPPPPRKVARATPFTPPSTSGRSKITTAVEHAATPLNKKIVLAILVSGILSASMVPLFYSQHPPSSATNAGDGSAVRKLEASIARLDKEQNKMKVEIDRLKVHLSRPLAPSASDEPAPADYASYDANGRVTGHSDLYPRHGDPWLVPSRDGDWFLFSLPYVSDLPKWVSSGLRKAFPVHPKASTWLLSVPSTGYEFPGHCLPLKGSVGHVDIKLRTGILLRSVSIEHISKASAFNITTAPREMAVHALSGGGQEESPVELGAFSYDIDSPPTQVFPIEQAPNFAVSRVRLEVRSNHGNEDYTCLYRFKAHGEPALVAT